MSRPKPGRPGPADFDQTDPTPDHFIPLVHFAALAEAAGGQRPAVLVDGYGE